MRPLVDSDILLYEIGFSSEKVELIEGVRTVVPASWDFCRDLFDKKISLICEEVGAKSPPSLFFTNTKKINKNLNKKRKLEGAPEKEYVDNFRFAVAKEKAYKGTRLPTKPFHFNNIFNYALAEYNTIVDETGLEADDAMCIEQYGQYKQGLFDTIICSRDKDLRQCPGWHYSWECGKQASIGPIMVDELGSLEEKGKDKVFGTGAKFFYYQMLVGDTVDNIGGIYNKGPKFALNLLKDAPSVRKAYELTAEVYVKTWGDQWKPKFREQADLLWMIRELDEKGEKVRWRPPPLEPSTTNG